MKVKELKLKDLDELIEYYESYPKDIHLHTFKFLRYIWNKTKIISDVDLYHAIFEDDEIYKSLMLTIYSNEWVKALELALNFFENQEDFDTCYKIKTLLIKIQEENLVS